jgi:hypothetical protein
MAKPSELPEKFAAEVNAYVAQAIQKLKTKVGDSTSVDYSSALEQTRRAVDVAYDKLRDEAIETVRVSLEELKREYVTKVGEAAAFELAIYKAALNTGFEKALTMISVPHVGLSDLDIKV